MKKLFNIKFLSFLLIAFFVASISYAAINIVPNGGTGVGTITGIIQGNGTSAFSPITIGSGLNFTGGTLSSTGTPGGLNVQLQYNNAGVFGGISGAVTNGTIVSLTNPLLGGATLTTSSVNGVTLTTGGSTSSFLNANGAYSSVTAASVPFNGITSGTNTTAAMVVGAGATLTAHGSLLSTIGNTTLNTDTGTGGVFFQSGTGSDSIFLDQLGLNATQSTLNINSFNIPILSAPNATPFDSATLDTSSTVYIAGAPVDDGTGALAINNPLALNVASGTTNLGGFLTVQGQTFLNDYVAINNHSLEMLGDQTVAFDSGGEGLLIASAVGGLNFTNTSIAAGGTQALMEFNAFGGSMIIGANGTSGSPATITDTATVNIEGPPVAGANTVLTHSYSFWVESGMTRLDGGLTAANAILTTSSVNGVTLTTGGSTSSFLNANGTYSSAGGSGTVTSLSSPNGTLTIGSPTTTPTLDVNLSHSNFFTTNQSASSFGIGTGSTTPASKLQVVDTSATTPRGILADEYATSTQGARITMRKARGTFASPTVIVTGDTLGSWTAAGYDGTNFIDSGKILVTSTGTIGTGIIPSTMALQTMNAAGTLTTGITIDALQQVTLSTIPAFGSTASLFLVSNGGIISSRTASQVRSDIGAGTGSGTVTSFAFTNGSGFTGTVSNSTTTPSLALTTSLTLGSVPIIGSSGALTEDNANFFYNSTSHFLGLGTTSPVSLLTVTTNALGATAPTAAQGIVLQNTTATTSSVTQNTPALALSSNGWNNVAGASQNLTWYVYSSPANNNPVGGNLNFMTSSNGGALATQLTITSSTQTLSGMRIINVNGSVVNSNSAAFIQNTRNAMGVVSGDGFISNNATPSTVSVTAQWAPRLRFTGTAWNTGGTPASNTDDFIMEEQTVSGNPTTSNLVISSQINAGGYNPRFTLASSGNLTLNNGNLILGTAGNKLSIATGSNASVGTATLSGGTVTVSTTAVTASSVILLTDATTGALTNVGSLTVGTKTAGTSFVINSTNPLDASSVNYLIIN